MGINPLIPAPQLALAFGALALVAGYVSWRAARRLPPVKRGLVTACRVALVGVLAVLALNPGRWKEDRDPRDRRWVILLDRSASMAESDAGPGGTATRFAEAQRLARAALDASGDPAAISVFPFGSDLENAAAGDDLAALQPQGEGTDLAAAGTALLARIDSRHTRLAGIIAVTDGRQTALNPPAGFPLRARAREAPVFALPVGGPVGRRDLIVASARREYIAYPGQKLAVAAIVTNLGLGEIRPEIRLLGPGGEEIARQPVAEPVPEGGTAQVAFEIEPASADEAAYTFATDPWPGESREGNNQYSFTVNVLPGKTRVFLAEGVPYWDTKFLAQLLRAQPHLEVTSVHRLAADRYFRVDTDADQPQEAADAIFPADSEEISSYDLIVFGKGSEYFFDDRRLSLLKAFLRDQGGAVLFARGKPYSGEFSALAALEPTDWGEPVRDGFSLEPTAAGEATGLFGRLLPGPGDEVWAQLPALKDAHRVPRLKPFTQVLAEGRTPAGETFPAIVSRRYGSGLITAINADGLWQWDFFPTAKEAAGRNMYAEFWGQMLQWAATYSEFLPGRQFSLRLSESEVFPGVPVQIRIGRRGAAPAADPVLRVTRTGGAPAASINPIKSGSGWEAVFTPEAPGEFRIELVAAADGGSGGQAGDKPLAATLRVPPPPAERDEVSADPKFLAELAEASGGRVIAESDLAEVVAQLEGAAADSNVDRDKAVWEPSWDAPWLLLAGLLFPAAEWFIRRRTGLL